MRKIRLLHVLIILSVLSMPIVLGGCDDPIGLIEELTNVFINCLGADSRGDGVANFFKDFMYCVAITL